MYASQMLDSMDFVGRSIAELENDMTSVERTLAYTELEPEAGHQNEKCPPEEWPSNGTLSFENISQASAPF